MTDLLFGLDISTSAAPGTDPIAAAREAEQLGFDFVSASDHPSGSHPTLETWTMLSWIAASTSRIRVATRVLGVPYRPPAMVAKMAETLDRLSGGRLILGLGGGASDEEFRAFGLDVRSPRDKITGLEEAVRICRGLWTERKFTHQRRLYQIAGPISSPSRTDPSRSGWVPSETELLHLTGRLADGWIPSLAYAPRGVLRRCGNASLPARARWAVTLKRLRAYNVEVNVGETDPRPSVVSGTAESVAEQLVGFLELGFTAMNFMPLGRDKSEQVQRLAHEVVPAIRAVA
jgi:alkanesulfonate monooxygenase SsuD/methylene tetrahydromethanopterin reductase-like flavin-dependent oxidoreductase (luciferase family)